MGVPVATYRLQFGPSFGFEDARAVVSYLARLGISDIYASPVMKATEGSAHGYDVTDLTHLNPQLGTRDDFQNLAAERRTHGIGWLQDIVPNHMAYSSQNALLMDVLERGPQSEYSGWFDIFRDHPDPQMQTKLLAPFLVSPLDDVLRRGELYLTLDQDGLALRCHDWRFPLALSCYDEVLKQGLENPDASGSPLQTLFGHDAGWVHLSAMSPGAERDERVIRAKREMVRLYAESEVIASYIRRALDFYNRPNDPSSLRALIDRQWYKPVFWQTANQAINYRRFFYLNNYIALHIEKPAVFERVHKRMAELARADVVTGLRVDHIDALYDPLAYLRRLRERFPDSYLVAEKILDLEEAVPIPWPVDGTSGYKFCNYVNGLFCDCGSEPALTSIYHDFIGDEPDYGTLLYETKVRVLQGHMGGEVAYLAGLLKGALNDDDPTSDDAWRHALAALIAAFPVYRTYVDARQFTDQDRAHITAAVLAAKKRAQGGEACIDRIGQFLLSYRPGAAPSARQEAHRHAVMRFQQFTAPAMAKGLEDTFFYTYNRFISLNEVGGDPQSFGIPLDRFHRFNEMRARHWPRAMNATSTHDAKRGEDVRARLNVLSEIPERWREKVGRWARMNAGCKQRRGGTPVPDANDEYFLYQTLIGALPFDQGEFDDFEHRLKDYTIKVLREAKRHTTWAEPNVSYEDGSLAFIERILDRGPHNAFWPDFLSFQREVSRYGIFNSLSQTTLKMTCPGLPDFYQGTELWDLNLVDPDNRRPVDFTLRKRALDACETGPSDPATDVASRLLAAREDGRVKLFLVHRLLHLRAAHRMLFATGDYLRLEVMGRWARHAVAFQRTDGNTHVLALVPRFLTALVDSNELPTGSRIWRDTKISLPDDVSGVWDNAITGQMLKIQGDVPVADVLAVFPVAVLLREQPRAQSTRGQDLQRHQSAPRRA